MGLLLLLILIALLISAWPTWPYSQAWGYRPVGIIGTLFFIVLILILLKIIGLWEIRVISNNKPEIQIEKYSP